MAKEQLPGLAERLKEARERVRPKMQLKDVGKALGRSSATVCYWENGEHEPGYSDLFKLSEIYGTTVQYLLGLVNNPIPTAVEDARIIKGGVPFINVEWLKGWRLSEAGSEIIQTSMDYTGQVAAAVRVDSEAVRNTCIPNDIVVVQKEFTPRSGDIVVVQPGGRGSVTLRRCRPDGDNILYVPDDTSFPSYNNTEVVVIGRVSEVIRRNLI